MRVLRQPQGHATQHAHGTDHAAASVPEAAAPQVAKPQQAGLLSPAQNADGRLKGERAEDFKGLAARGGLEGVHEAPATNVPVLSERYAIALKGRPEERFLKSLSTLDVALHAAGTNVDQAVEALNGHDGRREVFRLEGLLRLYAPQKKSLGPVLEKVKSLEDALGGVAVTKHALEIAQQKGMPASITSQLEAQQQKAAVHLQDLVKTEWMSGADGKSAMVETLAKAIDHVDFGSVAHDRKFLKQALADHVDHIREKKYSMTELNDGVHALRRQCRWTVLFTEALDGAVQLAPVKHHKSSYAPIVGNAALEQQYDFATYPAPSGHEKPIELPIDLYAGLQKSVFELGEIKDDAEAREQLEAAYQQAGLPQEQLEALLGDLGTVQNMKARATVVYDEIKQQNLLGHLHHTFEKA